MTTIILCAMCAATVPARRRSRRYCAACRRERHRAANRRWYARHRAWVKYTHRRWRLAHPDAVREHRRRHRERARAAPGHFTRAEFRALCAAQGGRCAYCNGTPRRLTVDHKTPLCRGGTNDLSNVCGCCGRCNWRKGRLTEAEFRARLAAEAAEAAEAA